MEKTKKIKKAISFLLIFAMTVSAVFLTSCHYLLNGYDTDSSGTDVSSITTYTEIVTGSTQNGTRTAETYELTEHETETETEADMETETETISPFGANTTASDTDSSAADNHVDPVEWEIDDSGVLTLSCTGELPDYKSGSDTPWYDERDNIKTAVITSGVTKISGKAFQGFTSLEEVSIPDSVSEIEDAAFSYCSELKKITVDSNNPKYSSDGSGALYNKNKSTLIQLPAAADGASYTLPDSVKTIGAQAFRGCSGLKDLKLNKGVTEIGDYAFGGCSDLETVDIPSSLTTIGDKAFASCTDIKQFTVDEKNPNYSSDNSGSLLNKDGSVLIRYPSGSEEESYTLPSTVSQLGDFAFAYCDGIKSITVTEGIKSIGSYAFLNCGEISEIIIPSSVKRIGDHAFDGCSGLKKITVNVNNAGYSSDENGVLFNKDKTKLVRFPAGSEITSYTVPESVLMISQYAFDGCASLESVTVAENAEDIREGAFMGCTSLKSVTLPNNIEKIADQLFSGCAALKKITAAGIDTDGTKDIMLPDSVTVIGSRAFEGCSSAETAALSESIAKVGAYAFAYCSSLTEITIPDSVKSIGANAFSGCDSLKILCSKNSNARKYAEYYKIKYGNA